jgi:hypothetical protein
MIGPELPPLTNELRHIQQINIDEFANPTLTQNYLSLICETVTSQPGEENHGEPTDVINCYFFRQKDGEVTLYLSTPESNGDTNYLYLVNIPYTNKLAIVLDTKNPEIALFSACTIDEDILSAQIVRSAGDMNPVTPTFAQTQAETTSCFNSINRPAELTLVDDQGNTAHTLFIPPRDGNQGIFESGSQPYTVLLEGREVSIQTLVDSLKIQLSASDNTSPENIDLKIITSSLDKTSIEQSLDFTPPKPIVVETKVAPVEEKPPTPILTNAEIAAETFSEAQSTNQIEGNVISMILDCQSESCPDIYKIHDVNNGEVQTLLSAILDQNYFDGTVQDKIRNIIHPTILENIVEYIKKVFKKPSSTPFTKIDAANFRLECSMVPYINESRGGKTIVCFTSSGDLYIIQGNENQFSDLQTFLHRDYQIDSQGTTLLKLNESNLERVQPASFATNDHTEIFVFPTGFRGDYSYNHLIFLSKELHGNTAGYALDANGNLVATQIPFGISGNYTGTTFFDEKTNTTYLGIIVTDISKSENQQQTYYIKVSEAVLPND